MDTPEEQINVPAVSTKEIINQIEEIDEDSILKYTINKRLELVSSITANGPPKHNETQYVLLAALDGLDKSALTRMKIKSDEKAAKDNGEAAAIIAKLLTQTNANQFTVETGHTYDAPIVDVSRIPDPVLVPDETSVAKESLTYDTFMAKMGSND